MEQNIMDKKWEIEHRRVKSFSFRWSEKNKGNAVKNNKNDNNRTGDMFELIAKNGTNAISKTWWTVSTTFSAKIYKGKTVIS